MDMQPSFPSISGRHRRRVCKFIDEQIRRTKAFHWHWNNYKIMMGSKIDLNSESDRHDHEMVSDHQRNNGESRDIIDVLIQQRRSIALVDSPFSDPLALGSQYSKEDFDTPSAYNIYESNLDLARSSARDVVCKTPSYEDTIAKALYCGTEDLKDTTIFQEVVQNITQLNDIGHEEVDLDRGTMNNNSSWYKEPDTPRLFEGPNGSSAEKNEICRGRVKSKTSPQSQDQKVIEKKDYQRLTHVQHDSHPTSSPQSQKARGSSENQKYFNDLVFENISQGEEAHGYAEVTEVPFHSNFKSDINETDVTYTSYRSEDADKGLHPQLERNTSYRRRALLESEETAKDKFPSAHRKEQLRSVSREMKPTSEKEASQLISNGHQTVEEMESDKLEKINSMPRTKEEVDILGLDRKGLQHHYPQPGMQQHLSRQRIKEIPVPHNSRPIAIEGQKGASNKRHRTLDFISSEDQEAAVKPETQRGNQTNYIFSGRKNSEEMETIQFQPQVSVSHPDDKVFCVSDRRDRNIHHYQSQSGTQLEQFSSPQGMTETHVSISGEGQQNYETEDSKYISPKHISKETQEVDFEFEKQGVKQIYHRSNPFSQGKHFSGEENVIETEIVQPQGSGSQPKEQVVIQPDIEVRENIYQDQSLPLQGRHHIEDHFEEEILQKEVNSLKQSNVERQRENQGIKREARHRSLPSYEMEMSNIRSKSPELNASENQEMVIEAQIRPEKHTQYRSEYVTKETKTIKPQVKVENVGQPNHRPKSCHCVKESQVAQSSSSEFLIEGSTLSESIRNTLDRFIKLILQGQSHRTKGASLDDTCSPEEQYLVQQMRRKLGRYKHKLKVGKKILDEQVQRVLSMIHQRNKAPPGGREEGYYTDRVDQEMFILQGMVDEMIILAQKYGASETSCLVLEYIGCFLKDMAKNETQFRFSPAQSLEVETTDDFLKGLRRVMITEEMTDAELSKHGLSGVFGHHSAETKNQKHVEKPAEAFIIPLPEEKVNCPVVIAPVITTGAEREVTPKLFSHSEKTSEPDLSYPAWYMPGILHSEEGGTSGKDPDDESHLESARDVISKATQTSACLKYKVSEPQIGLNIFNVANQAKTSIVSFGENSLAELSNVFNSSAFEVSDTQSQPNICDTCQSGFLSRGFPQLSTIREAKHVLQDMILFFLLFLTFLFLVVLTVRNYTPCGMIYDRDIIMNLDFRHIGIPTW